MHRRMAGRALLLLGGMVLLFSCSREEDRGKSGAKGVALAPRQGVWRSLKLLEASLNLRNFEGYLKVFSGAALHDIRKEMTAARFRNTVKGRFKLAAFHIVKHHSRSLVTVRYAFRQFLPGRKALLNPGEAMFSAARGRSHWVIISLGSLKKKAAR